MLRFFFLTIYTLITVTNVTKSVIIAKAVCLQVVFQDPHVLCFLLLRCVCVCVSLWAAPAPGARFGPPQIRALCLVVEMLASDLPHVFCSSNFSSSLFSVCVLLLLLLFFCGSTGSAGLDWAGLGLSVWVDSVDVSCSLTFRTTFSDTDCTWLLRQVFEIYLDLVFLGWVSFESLRPKWPYDLFFGLRAPRTKKSREILALLSLLVLSWLLFLLVLVSWLPCIA